MTGSSAMAGFMASFFGVALAADSWHLELFTHLFYTGYNAYA